MQTVKHYSRETLNRRLKKYGIGIFLEPSISKEEILIVNSLLDGESLETYYHNLISGK